MTAAEAQEGKENGNLLYNLQMVNRAIFFAVRI